MVVQTSRAIFGDIHEVFHMTRPMGMPRFSSSWMATMNQMTGESILSNLQSGDSGDWLFLGSFHKNPQSDETNLIKIYIYINIVTALDYQRMPLGFFNDHSKKIETIHAFWFLCEKGFSRNGWE